MSDNDLIRRGDALKAMHSHDWQKTYDAIAAIPAVTAPQGVDAAIEALISERDYAQEIADKLAFAIGGDAIGEHSNMNCPWQNALEIAVLAPAQPAPTEWNAAIEAAAFLSVSEMWDDPWELRTMILALRKGADHE